MKTEKIPNLNEVCYVCRYLHGFVMSPECKKKESVWRGTNENCSKFTPILGETEYAV